MKISETKILHLPILVEQDEDDFYIVSCSVFKGCHSYGSTIEEALENVGFREMQVSINSATA